MKTQLRIAALALALCASAGAEEYVYQGPWNTTNRKLDGDMTCIVTPLARHEWQGRFYGTWQGVPFDYTVNFTGPAKDLRGTTTIDGASYEWRARIDRGRFLANFSGDRYTGSFDLKRIQSPAVTQRPRPATATR
jgi:hypothetical protein